LKHLRAKADLAMPTSADVEAFQERLGRGIERLAAGDFSMFADRRRRAAVDRETASELADLLRNLTMLSASAELAEAAALAVCRAVGMDETMILAAQELGRRKGRRAMAALLRAGARELGGNDEPGT
jgi:hypothetical protein